MDTTEMMVTVYDHETKATTDRPATPEEIALMEAAQDDDTAE